MLENNEDVEQATSDGRRGALLDAADTRPFGPSLAAADGRSNEVSTADEPAARYLRPVPDAGYEIRRVRYGGKSIGRELLEAAILSLIVFVLIQSLVQNRKVEGESMEPSLQNEQRLLIDRLSYFHFDSNTVARLFDKAQTLPDNEMFLFGGPERGDIIVFRPPVDETRDYIKRVIAKAGETVQIKAFDGVYVDGVKLIEPYEKDTPDYSYGPLLVPAGDVFVLGDNRRDSSDSHIWGPLDITRIVGRAWISLAPLDDFGMLPHPSYAGVER